MTLLDRFRAQPPQKHADPIVRLAFVQEVSIEERELLAEMARDDVDARVRRAAVAKLMDPSALAAVAGSDSDAGVRDEALTMLRDIALDAFEGVAEADSLAAVEALTDAKSLASIAKAALREDVALSALGRVGDTHALGSIARHARLEPIRLAALAALQDRGEVLEVALNSDFKDTAIAAAERLDDQADLDQVAARAKNKGAAKRARAILREMSERAALAEAPAITVMPVIPIVTNPDELVLDERTVQEAVVEAPAVDVARAEEAPDAAQREEKEEEAARLEAEAAQARAEADAATAREREEEQAREQKRVEELADDERRRAEERAALEARKQLEQAEARAVEARVRQQTLARLTELAGRAERLAASTAVPPFTLKTGERALRDVRAAAADVPPLPSKREHEAMVQRLKDIQAALTAKVQEVRELTEWQRWANLGVQEQLCARMEALATLEDPLEVARQVHELQEQWRQASDVPRPQGEALWRRFSTAHDLVWARCAAHFAAEAKARGEHLAKKIEMCERVEALAGSTAWIQTAEEIKRLQAEWKSIGPVTRGQEKAVWERFRSACDRFFTRRHADFAEHKKMWAANLEKKLALCAQVEALADSTDWDGTAAEIKRLQNEWKTIGPVKKTRSEAIWQRFRGACDRFFSRYAQRHEIARGERLAAREAICAELEALAPPADSIDGPSESQAAPRDLPAAVRAIRGRWQQELAARGVDREHAAALDQRFAAAFARVLAASPEAFAGTDLDPDANRKRMEALVRRVEELGGVAAPGGEAADAALSPTTRLAAMLKEALAANTIGGKVDDESRWRAAAEEVRQAEASWTRIGPVPDGVRRQLTDRFQRACRRITERAAAAGGTGRASGPGRPAGPARAGQRRPA